jgi:cellulose synthase operon protein C
MEGIMRTIRATIARGVLLAAYVAIAGCGRIDPAVEMSAAVAGYEAGEYRTAAIRLRNVLQIDPGNAAALALQGRLSLLVGDLAGARTQFERAIAGGVAPETLALVLADTLIKLREDARAIAVLDAATVLDGEPLYWVLRASAYGNLRRIDEADNALARIADLGPDSARALVTRAGLAALRGAMSDAEGFFARAVELAPNDPQVRSARGEFYLKTGRLASAVTDFDAAVQQYRTDIVTPEEAGVRLALVQANLALNDPVAAASAADQLAARAPNASMTAYVKGLIAYRNGEFDEARAVLQGAVNAQPSNPPLLTLFGAAHLALGNLGQAEQHLLKAVSLSPDDAAAIKLLAETRLRQQRPLAALDSLKPLADLGAEDADIGLLSGLANLLAGNAEAGIVYLEQAAALSPGNQMLMLELSRAYLAVGRQADAAAVLERTFAASAGDGDFSAKLMLLFARVRAGDIDGGRERAAAMTAEFPNYPPALTAVAAFHRLIGERRAAREELEQALRADGAYVPARMLLAAALVDDGRTLEGEDQLRAVLELEPNNDQALTALAQLAMRRDGFREAEELLTRALTQAPPTLSKRLVLAQVYVNQGKLADAERVVAAAYESDPSNVEVTAARGMMALAAGRAQEALTLLKQAHEAVPNRLALVLGLARAQMATDQPTAARDTLRSALAAAPDSLSLRAALGAAELRLGNADEALKIANALQVDYPEQAPGYLLEADTRIAQRRYDAALTPLESAFQRQPTWQMLTRRITGLRLASRPADAEAAVAAWVKDNPAHVPGRVVLASVFQASGRADEAADQYRRILDIDEANVAALNNLAWLLNEAGQEGALSLAERAYAEAPENPSVLDTLGWILATQKREQDAIGHLEKASELMPEAVEIRYHVAQVQARLGRVDEARSSLERLLADDRQFPERAAARALLESL